MVGRGALMRQLFALIRRSARYLRTALVTGETGTGKELVARALHDLGPRAARRFMAVNCSAVVDTLFESELFGHERGAFTGATCRTVGFFEAADGGTLFLDEIGELSLAMQAKLLRAIETGEVQRVGSLQTHRVDVRVVTATNRNLDQEVAAGRFRSDLLYRLNALEFHVPPLRDRREDIPDLTGAFIRECAARLNKRVSGVTSIAEEQLLGYRWPGNVRELKNAIEHACILADSCVLMDEHLPHAIRAGQPESREIRSDRKRGDEPRYTLACLEGDHVLRTLADAGGNKNLAAQMLGISRFALYRKLNRLEPVACCPS